VLSPQHELSTGSAHCGWVKDESREYWYDQGELVVVKPAKYNQRFKSIDSLEHTAEWQKWEGVWWLKSDGGSESQRH